jgi:hypothetical protein
MYANLDSLSNFELLIAAGLWKQRPHRGDFKYLAFIAYQIQIEKRGLSWDRAKRAAADMVKRTRYPKSGWEKRYVKVCLVRQQRSELVHVSGFGQPRRAR